MKKKFFILFSLIIIGCKGSYNESESNLTGTYYSVKPSDEEKISIMYPRGYFDFVYTKPNDDCLELKENNLFTHHINYCKLGQTNYDGKWSVEKNTLIIDYFDISHADLKFIIIQDKIYTIRDFKTIINNKEKTIKSLTLMKKK